MKKIQVLDCTLRDGGYCNDCRFEYNNIKKEKNKLYNFLLIKKLFINFPVYVGWWDLLYRHQDLLVQDKLVHQ